MPTTLTNVACLRQVGKRSPPSSYDKPNFYNSDKLAGKRNESSRSPSVRSQSSTHANKYTHVKSKVNIGLKRKHSPPPTPRVSQPASLILNLNKGPIQMDKTCSTKATRRESASALSGLSSQKENLNLQNRDSITIEKQIHPIQALKGKS